MRRSRLFKQLFDGRDVQLSWWDMPVSATRAAILYRLFPADETFWFRLSQPAMWAYAALLVTPYAGCGAWVATRIRISRRSHARASAATDRSLVACRSRW